MSRIYQLLVCCTIALLIGCGNGQLATHPVEGQLLFDDGTTPMFGQIEFYNAENKLNARGEINRDGTFTVGTYVDGDGAVEGSHKIMIVQVTGNYLTANLDTRINHDHGELVDPVYFDYRTSGLTADIQPGVNKVELTLRKNPSQTKDGLPTE